MVETHLMTHSNPLDEIYQDTERLNMNRLILTGWLAKKNAFFLPVVGGVVQILICTNDRNVSSH